MGCAAAPHTNLWNFSCRCCCCITVLCSHIHLTSSSDRIHSINGSTSSTERSVNHSKRFALFDFLSVRFSYHYFYSLSAVSWMENVKEDEKWMPIQTHTHTIGEMFSCIPFSLDTMIYVNELRYMHFDAFIAVIVYENREIYCDGILVGTRYSLRWIIQRNKSKLRLKPLMFFDLRLRTRFSLPLKCFKFSLFSCHIYSNDSA